MLGKIKLDFVANPQFSAVDPFDARYFDSEVSKYLSEQSRIAYQAHVESALALTLAEFGICSEAIANEIVKSAQNISASDVAEEELTTHHDIKAVVNIIKKSLSDDAKPFVHFGATSYDIISTAQSLQMKTAVLELVLPRIESLIVTLAKLTEKYADTIQIGRTHGQHGVPITFGFAVAEYVSRLSASHAALESLANGLQGKFSGAVGAYNATSLFTDDPMKFEESVLSQLGLTPAPYSNQIVPAENIIRLLDELAIAAGIMANVGHDMRHLQRSEIAEIREHFATGQTGSSTMAHKRNPWNFENVVSMSKQVLAQSLNANLNITSEHQRDLTDSAASRFYPISLASVASMTSRLTKIMSKIEVDEEAMQRNLHLSNGAIAAEPLYLLFEKHGHIAAHEKSKELSQKALSEGKKLVDVILSDEEATLYWHKFTDLEQKIISNPEQYYTGLAAKKAKAIADQVRSKFK